MNITKKETETYVLTDLKALDPVTVYVTNYEPGKGKIVIDCYGEAWSQYWGGMSGMSLQNFFVTCDNDYILGKFLKDTTQTDFDEIEKLSGGVICASSDVEIAMMADDMRKHFGDDWYMDLPRCKTSDYRYLGRIVDAVKAAFSEELAKAA